MMNLVANRMRVIQERDGNNLALVSYTRGEDLSGSLEGCRLDLRLAGAGDNGLRRKGKMMKTTMRIGLLLGVCALLGVVEPVSAYYDPGVQRWINRDPIEESGGNNLLLFTLSNPVSKLDQYGLSPAKYAPPTFDPRYWKNPIRQRDNNCYNYACDKPAGHNGAPPNWQPGQTKGKGEYSEADCDSLTERVKAEGGESPDCDRNCPEGYHKIRPWVRRDGKDFHFYRQDDDGRWSHKPGRRPVSRVLQPDAYKDYKQCSDLCVPNQPLHFW